MEREYTSLLANEMSTLIEFSLGRRAIQNKWVFKVKTATDGSVSRYKARLVAKGFSQREGVDYSETFSHVVKFDSIRTIILIAAVEDMHIIQFDVETAFLHGAIEEDIFMAQPKGFVDSSHPTKVCKLQKALYGLKQALRV